MAVVVGIQGLELVVAQVVAVVLSVIAHIRLGVLALRVKDMLAVKALTSPVFGKVVEAEVVQAR